MKTAAEFVGLAGFISLIWAQIWIVLIIMRGSPFAALLCLIIPFLYLGFVSDHWEESRGPVFTWFAGLIALIAGITVSSFS